MASVEWVFWLLKGWSVSVFFFPSGHPASLCPCHAKNARVKIAKIVPVSNRVIFGQKSARAAKKMPVSICEFVPVQKAKSPCQYSEFCKKFYPPTVSINPNFGFIKAKHLLRHTVYTFLTPRPSPLVHILLNNPPLHSNSHHDSSYFR